MDAYWLDRLEVERRLPPDAIDFESLDYDYDQSLYCHQGRRFTGFAVQRHADGGLKSVVTFRDGVEDGVSVTWHLTGGIERYVETKGEMFHGEQRVWDEDGTIITDAINDNDVRVSGYGDDDP